MENWDSEKLVNVHRAVLLMSEVIGTQGVTQDPNGGMSDTSHGLRGEITLERTPQGQRPKPTGRQQPQVQWLLEVGLQCPLILGGRGSPCKSPA